jgi:hypothetical protein
MRRAAFLAAFLLFALVAGAPHAAAEPPACQDGYDNDGDGRADYPDDPGCSAPDDDDERSCTPGTPAECDETQDCAGMLPPGPLTATWSESGDVILHWSAPLAGQVPMRYLVFRVQLIGGDTEFPPLPPVGSVPGVEISVDTGGLGHGGVGADPGSSEVRTPDLIRYELRVPDLDRKPINVPIDVPAALGIPLTYDPYAAVPGGQTEFIDTAVERDAAYAYWVEGSALHCRGPSSNMAIIVFGFNFPPRLEDCFYVDPWAQPRPTVVGPYTGCIGNIP